MFDGGSVRFGHMTSSSRVCPYNFGSYTLNIACHHTPYVYYGH